MIFWPPIFTASPIAINCSADKISRQLKTETQIMLGYENTVYLFAHQIRIKTIHWEVIAPIWVFEALGRIPSDICSEKEAPETRGALILLSIEYSSMGIGAYFKISCKFVTPSSNPISWKLARCAENKEALDTRYSDLSFKFLQSLVLCIIKLCPEFFPHYLNQIYRVSYL